MKDFLKQNLVVIIGTGLFLLVGIVFWRLDREGDITQSDSGIIISESINNSDSQAQVETKAKLIVYVCGQVTNPGVYELETGSRMIDAINLAGGFTEAAQADLLNLAQLITDGLKIYVPAIGEDANKQDVRVNINTASEQELMTLPGIGSSRALDIIAYRKEHGDFKTIEDIMSVTGIKEAAFAKIKDYIRVS